MRLPGIDDGPLVFIANLMTHFSPRDILVYSNCEEVRLYKNGVQWGMHNVEATDALPHCPVLFPNVFSDKMDLQRVRAEGIRI
jgi:beta-galactosidase